MKMIIWVTKHFHTNIKKDGLVPNVGKIKAGILNDGDTQIAVEEMLDGVLTMGTFTNQFEHEPNLIKTATSPAVGNPEILVQDDETKRKGNRITLADLFMEDAEIKPELECSNIVFIETKNGVSLGNKFIPKVRDESLPIKKFHHMMKGLLKKKIHPELPKMKKEPQRIQPLSLLQTQDGFAWNFGLCVQ